MTTTTRGWWYAPGDTPDSYTLHHHTQTDPVAELLWLNPVRHQTIAIHRLVEALNRPAAECHPSLRPVWIAEQEPYGPGTGYTLAVTSSTGTTPGIFLVWSILPNDVAHWMQRILDGLNPGHGLDEVLLDRQQGSAA